MSDSTPTAETMAAFRASLDDKDRTIHDLAVKMLKTRYTPWRSNAWIQWQKKQTTHK